MPLLLALLLFATSLSAQPIPMNFDKLLVGADKMIVVQPPEGKQWTILLGSLATSAPMSGSIMAWLDFAPYAPYRDPETGEMRGCVRCVTFIHEDARHTFVPIVGGFGRGLRGQSQPIVLAYPNRMILAVTPSHGALPQPVMTWTRLLVMEHSLVP